jgi:hypothetical protein
VSYFRLELGDTPETIANYSFSALVSSLGVFFTVCMALLLLSLSKSIVLVKFLHDERCSGKEQPLLCLRGDIDGDGSRMDSRAQCAGITGLWEALRFLFCLLYRLQCQCSSGKTPGHGPDCVKNLKHLPLSPCVAFYIRCWHWKSPPARWRSF